MRTFQKADSSEQSLCLIRTLDAMGLPIRLQKKFTIYYLTSLQKKTHNLPTDFNLTKIIIGLTTFHVWAMASPLNNQIT